MTGSWARGLGAVIRAGAGLAVRRPAASRSGTRRGRRRLDGASAPDHDESPGRAGADATRDLTAEEIRRLRPHYAPHPDGDPDPGEVVWTWVPYVENDGRGKDRPVLIIARVDGTGVAGCYLSTKPHPGFVPVGSGGWDSQGRPSYLAPERLLRVSHTGMRREGQQLPRDRFDRAVAAVAAAHGLSFD